MDGVELAGVLEAVRLAVYRSLADTGHLPSPDRLAEIAGSPIRAGAAIAELARPLRHAIVRAQRDERHHAVVGWLLLGCPARLTSRSRSALRSQPQERRSSILAPRRRARPVIVGVGPRERHSPVTMASSSTMAIIVAAGRTCPKISPCTVDTASTRSTSVSVR